MKLYHGSSDGVLENDQLSTGICLTDNLEIAAEYGKYIYTCTITNNLTEQNLENGDGACGWYPPETMNMYQLEENGIDVVTFDWDATRHNNTIHKTWWVVSDQAMIEVIATWTKQ